jgi:hypothetical protein
VRNAASVNASSAAEHNWRGRSGDDSQELSSLASGPKKESGIMAPTASTSPPVTPSRHSTSCAPTIAIDMDIAGHHALMRP